VTQHFPRNTVSATFYCSKCAKPTPHRIDDKRKGPCLVCIDRLELEHKELEAAAAAADEQGELFHA